MVNNITSNPAQLFIGNHENLLEDVQLLLQQQFCKNNVCNICQTCLNIRAKSHYAITWTCPEKMYTLEDINPILHTLSFALEENTKHFFILEKADFLSPACANRLLKPLEEPPKGYHFLLLAERIDNIISTIKSRCIIHSNTLCTTNNQLHPIYRSFTSELNKINPLEFLNILEKNIPNERETQELLDNIISYWNKRYKNKIEKKENCSSEETIINILLRSSDYPPMPGSSKIFWKNLFLYFV